MSKTEGEPQCMMLEGLTGAGKTTDEFHQLYDSETDRILQKVSDWLKILIKETGVPFLVVGIDGRIETILGASSQLSRLFATREALQPFQWDPTRSGTQQEFSRFIEYVERPIGLPLSQELPRLEFLYRIHYGTDGVVGSIMKLMRYAAWLARVRGKSAIDLALLHAAFEKRLRAHQPKKVNPFGDDYDESFVTPAPVPDDPGNMDHDQRRGRKRPWAVGQLLSTQPR